MTGAVLTEGRPPRGYWAQRREWEIATMDGSVRARLEARAAVAAAENHGQHPTGHVFAAASERVALTMGELTVNGLRHGGPPVTASLARGTRGWLTVVSDAATDKPPTDPTGQDVSAVGGLGLRLVMSMSVEVGWCVERGRKLVWALTADEPSPQLITRLDSAVSS